MNGKEAAEKEFQKWDVKTNKLCNQEDEQEHPFSEYWCCEKHQSPEAAFKAGFKAGIRYYSKIVK